jgi:hypothetical protein
MEERNKNIELEKEGREIMELSTIPYLTINESKKNI